MREVAAKAATDESTVGLLKIMDDIAGLGAARPPSIAAGGYRVLKTRSQGPRPTRTAAIAPRASGPKHMRGFLTALFAGGLGLAVLAGPVSCPSCEPAQADGQLDAERIRSRLSYTSDLPGKIAGRETAPAQQSEAPAVADRSQPETLSTVALAEPQDSAAQLSTAAIGSAPDRVPDSATAVPAAESSAHAAKLPDAIEELPAARPPQIEIAAATADGEPEAPLPPVGATTLPLKDVADVDPDEPAPSASAPHRHVIITPHRAKARAPATRAAPSAPKLYAPNKYRRVPGWAAKMFETPWQTRAFAFQ